MLNPSEARPAPEVGAGRTSPRAVAAVIPAHNEAGRVEAVLAVLRDVGEVSDIVVVDDGSTDDTYGVIRRASTLDARVRCLRLPFNRGKGAAMFVGARAAGADLLVFLDADLRGLKPEHVRALIAPVGEGAVDMAIGVFRGGRWATDLAHWLTPWLSGQRCLRAELFFQVSERSAAGYGIETALTLAAQRYGWRCEQVPLRGVFHPPSEFHHGLWRGLRVRARMYAQIGDTWHRERGWNVLLSRRWTAWPQMGLLVLLLVLGAGLASSHSAAGPRQRPGDLPGFSLEGVHRLLVVAAHPEDEMLAAGGALQAALAVGVEVQVIVVTQDADRTPTERAQPQEAELAAARRALGLPPDATLRLAYPAGELEGLWLDNWPSQCAPIGAAPGHPPTVLDAQAGECGSDLLRDLRRIIGDFQPDLVLIPHPNDEHPDHRVSANFARLALALESEASLDHQPQVWGYLVHYGSVQHPYGLLPSQPVSPPPPLAGEGNHWARLVLTPAQIAAKTAALRALGAQQRLLGSVVPSQAQGSELFAELPLSDVSTLAYSELPVREAGVVAQPRLPALMAESRHQQMLRGADLVSLQVGRLGDQVALIAETRGRLVSGLQYRFLVKLPDGQTHIMSWPGSALRSGRSTFTAMLDLEELGNPPALAVAAQVRQGVLLDRTGWHILMLEGN